MLNINNLHVSINGKEILKGINLDVHEGEVHAIMGPNGTGKSTLASVIAGRDVFEVTEGTITFKGKDIFSLSEMKRRPFSRLVFTSYYRDSHDRESKHECGIISPGDLVMRSRSYPIGFWVPRQGMLCRIPAALPVRINNVH